MSEAKRPSAQDNKENKQDNEQWTINNNKDNTAACIMPAAIRDIYWDATLSYFPPGQWLKRPFQ